MEFLVKMEFLRTDLMPRVIPGSMLVLYCCVGAAASVPPPTDALLSQGKVLYTTECAACHGLAGQGDGPASYLLYPKPRDFVSGQFRLVSTWERLPTDQDLFGVITRGMPGSSMPAFAHLSEEKRWALVHYIKSLSSHDWPGDADALEETGIESQKGLIAVPAVPEFTPEWRTRAEQLFSEGCAACHGPTGRGDGQQVQVDAKGYPTRPRDLSSGIYKGMTDWESVYRRIVAGLPGSPMPLSDWAYGEQATLLTQYVLSLSSEEQRAALESTRKVIRVTRSPEIPIHPDAAAWQTAAPETLTVTPMWWRDSYPRRITVRAMHDGQDIAIQLIWVDGTHDHTAIRTEDFRDAAAIQLSPDLLPPFIGMGDTANQVHIWMWKSERQENIRTAFQDIETVYPNLGIDSYPSTEASPLEQPPRHALTLKSDPAFVTGWAAGNIVSDPAFPRSVESLSARGFGSLTARPLVEQNIEAVGRYSTSSYSVTFRRKLQPEGESGIALGPGTSASIAFAVWDGSAGDRDGKKCVTIWHELDIEP